jgi:putative endonuclease
MGTSMKEKKYYTYIMGSITGTLYTGMTSNLSKRVFQHKFHEFEGFTARYDVVRLLYFESFVDVHRAIRREKQIKGWKRERKIALIESINPHWLDLAKDWYPWVKEQTGGRDASTPPAPSLREGPDSAQHDRCEGTKRT